MLLAVRWVGRLQIELILFEKGLGPCCLLRVNRFYFHHL